MHTPEDGVPKPQWVSVPFACWRLKTLTACRTVCRTMCRTLWSVYWAGGDRTAQDVCLWLVFPTAAFSDSILLKPNYFCLSVQLSPPGNFDSVDCLHFSEPLDVNAVLVWLLLCSSAALQLHVLPVASQIQSNGDDEVEKSLFSVHFLLYLTGRFF